VAFGISYFTLGPQIGGELAQILFLQKRHKVPVKMPGVRIVQRRISANFTFAIGSIALRMVFPVSADKLMGGFFPVAALVIW
jgi:hypothetical protein